MEQTLHVESEAVVLYQELLNLESARKEHTAESPFTVSDAFRKRFFALIDALNLRLLDDSDNFYGYFLFQTGRDLRFDLESPAGTSFKDAKYIMYFNPFLFLPLTPEQMESTLKHEILHILSLHLLRAKELRKEFSPLAVNLAMDIVVNTYISPLPADAVTLAVVNLQYGLAMPLFETVEYYAEEIQTALDRRQPRKKEPDEGTRSNDALPMKFNPETTHDIWDESDDIDEKAILEFTQKAADGARKEKLSSYLDSLLATLANKSNTLPWYAYLKKVVRTVAAERKKTTTRRNRRQPERLDLRGDLRNRKAKVYIALDISGSISDEEFKQAMEQVLQIVKVYNHDITLIECDNEIRRIYHVDKLTDLKERFPQRGGTAFAPVINYCNGKNPDILVYFTDGKGEEKLPQRPKGYSILWLLSGKDRTLSLARPYGVIKKLMPIKSKDPLFDFDTVEKGGFSMANQERNVDLHEYIRG